MDNTKTGCFIKEVRTQKGMTQKELAGLLHVTDRAVSKWERGQCAPDIALLEPLSEALGVSIVELLQGERLAPGVQAEEAEARAKRLLGYSRQELRRKLRAFRAKYAAAAACLAALILLGGLLLWRGDTSPSWTPAPPPTAPPPSPSMAGIFTAPPFFPSPPSPSG